MGWTFTARDRSDGDSKAFFAREFDYAGGRVLDVAATLKDAYIAYELLDKATGASRGVIAIICLIAWRRNDAYNFGWKDMDESMGPYASNCPKRILDMLTPIEKLYADGVYTGRTAVSARRWRRAAAKRLALQAARPSLKVGMVLTWDPPLYFPGIGQIATLQCTDARRRVFARPGSTYGQYRVRRNSIADAKVVA